MKNGRNIPSANIDDRKKKLKFLSANIDDHRRWQVQILMTLGEKVGKIDGRLLVLSANIDDRGFPFFSFSFSQQGFPILAYCITIDGLQTEFIGL